MEFTITVTDENFHKVMRVLDAAAIHFRRNWLELMHSTAANAEIGAQIRAAEDNERRLLESTETLRETICAAYGAR